MEIVVLWGGARITGDTIRELCGAYARAVGNWIPPRIAGAYVRDDDELLPATISIIAETDGEQTVSVWLANWAECADYLPDCVAVGTYPDPAARAEQPF